MISFNVLFNLNITILKKNIDIEFCSISKIITLINIQGTYSS